MINEIVTVKISKHDLDFIVDNALNGIWNHCLDKLLDSNLGDRERTNLLEIRDTARRLMIALDNNI